MDNITFSRGKDFYTDPDPITSELLKDSLVQVVFYHFYPHDRLAITSDKDASSLVIYVLDGELSLFGDDVETHLGKNDSVMFSDITNSLVLTAKTDARCLGISTCHSQQVISSNKLMSIVAEVEKKDTYTYGHSRRVCLYSHTIALEIDHSYDIIALGNAANLHDIGKINVPIEILRKPGKLTKEEFDIIRQHPVDTYTMLLPIGEGIATAASQHHERMDGSGYPNGLKGEEICLDARIIAVADVFDALTCKRIYNEPMSFMDAIAYLESCGAQYDQNIIAALKRKVVDMTVTPDTTPFVVDLE